MSTIVGRFNLDGRPVEREAIAQMLQVQHHRGPGRKEVWVDGAVGLGHGLNRIADHTPYPLHSADGNLTLVADARIDNREELARQLNIQLHPDQDGPLILAAYQRWGVDCAEKLLGDFAFVIWDAREQRLFGARDVFGARSLFYHHSPGKHFVLTSEIKGLWCHPDIPKAVDEVRVAETLQLIDTDAARTMFEGVWAIPAAHHFVVTRQRLHMSRYWQATAGETWHEASDEAYAEAFRERFLRSVKRRMRGTDAVAAELSGGLDSSSIACAARDVRREKGGQPLDTISLRYPDYPDTDEGVYIQSVLDTGHFAHHEQLGSSRSSLTDVEHVLNWMDDPSLVAGNHHHVWMRFELAHQHGMQVVLTGFDGDTVVGHGFERFYEFARAGQWEDFRRNAAAYERNMVEGGSGPGDQIYMAAQSILMKYGAGSLKLASEGGAWRDYFRMLGQLHATFGFSRQKYLRLYAPNLITPKWLVARQNRKAPSPMIAPSLAARTDLADRMVQSSVNPETWPVSARAFQAEVLSRPQYLRTVEALDTYGAAFSIEGRYPFLDRELVDFALRLPVEQSFREGWSRFVLRRAMQGILPEKVRTRPGKTSFAASSDHSMMDHDAPKLKAMVQDPVGLEAFIDLREVKRVAASPVEEWDRDAMRLAHLVSIQQWLRRHF